MEETLITSPQESGPFLFFFLKKTLLASQAEQFSCLVDDATLPLVTRQEATESLQVKFG